jgi:hypothetical protein
VVDLIRLERESMEDSMEMALKDLPGVCDIISSFGKKSYISCFGTKWEETLKA